MGRDLDHSLFSLSYWPTCLNVALIDFNPTEAGVRSPLQHMHEVRHFLLNPSVTAVTSGDVVQVIIGFSGESGSIVSPETK